MTTAHDNFLFIRREMCGHLSPHEVADLCHRLGVNPAVVLRDMTTLDEKVDDLLEWAARNQLEARLLALLQEEWPAVAWPGDYAYSSQRGGLPTAPYMPPPPPAPGQLPDPGPLPPGSRLVFGRNALFTGREEDLLALAEQLLPTANTSADPEPATRDAPPATRNAPPATPSAAVGDRRSAVVSSGIGGIGKTQLAVEFAHRYGRFFHGVHWVSMADPAAVAAEIAQCGAQMGLQPDFDGLPLEAQTRLTLAAWGGPAARLIIFDNCEMPGLLAEWQPAAGGARALVTSRNTEWPPEYGAAVRPVAPLPRAQSVALLREYVGPARAAEELSRVAAELGDLPLALALAGHYLARYRRESSDAYLRRLAQTPDLVPVGRGAVSLTAHDLSVWRTFAVGYARLDAADAVDGAAVALLARAACFAPGEAVGEELLLSLIHI